MDSSPPGYSVHGDSPAKSTGVGCHAFLQGTVPIQGSSPGFLHCRQILYHLSHQGSQWISLLQGIFWTQEIKLGSPALQVDSLPAELPGEPQLPVNLGNTVLWFLKKFKRIFHHFNKSCSSDNHDHDIWNIKTWIKLSIICLSCVYVFSAHPLFLFSYFLFDNLKYLLKIIICLFK